MIERVGSGTIIRRTDTAGFEMRLTEADELALDKQLDEICEGFREAIDREVETLRREGLPIYVADDDRIVDLQRLEPGQ